MQHVELIATGIGLCATAAVLASSNARARAAAPSATCASARVAETVSARAAVPAEPAQAQAQAQAEDPFSDLWGLSDEGEAQMKRASVPKSQEQDERVKNAKLAVRARQVDSIGKGIGTYVPSIGRSLGTAQPAVTAECMWSNMSDEQSRALEAQQESSA